MRFGANRIADYDERGAQMRAAFEERNGLQPGDPVKLAEAMVRLANELKPSMRFLAGSVPSRRLMKSWLACAARSSSGGTFR